jgi:hypothetical protein
MTDPVSGAHGQLVPASHANGGAPLQVRAGDAAQGTVSHPAAVRLPPAAVPPQFGQRPQRRGSLGLPDRHGRTARPVSEGLQDARRRHRELHVGVGHQVQRVAADARRGFRPDQRAPSGATPIRLAFCGLPVTPGAPRDRPAPRARPPAAPRASLPAVAATCPAASDLAAPRSWWRRRRSGRRSRAAAVARTAAAGAPHPRRAGRARRRSTPHARAGRRVAGTPNPRARRPQPAQVIRRCWPTLLFAGSRHAGGQVVGHHAGWL